MQHHSRKKTFLSPRRRAQISVLFWLFQPATPDEIKRLAALQCDENSPEFNRIRCPLCKWQPPSHMRWQCADCGAPEFYYGGCGTIWHTFDTHGICPGCKHQWKWTKCFNCDEWSLHEEWYAHQPE